MAKSTGAGKKHKEIALAVKLQKELLIWALLHVLQLGLLNEWQMKHGLRTHNSLHRCTGLDAQIENSIKSVSKREREWANECEREKKKKQSLYKINK